MKNYEQKYTEFLDKWIDLLDNAKNQGHIVVRIEDIENAFPELKESKDEKIRKALIDVCNRFLPAIWETYNCKKDEVLAWLEKQGEQKTVEWSKDDEEMLDNIIDDYDEHDYLVDDIGKIMWLKSLKPNHWKPSEEQMNELSLCCDGLEFNKQILYSLYKDLKKL